MAKYAIYVLQGNETLGPFSKKRVLEMISSGALSPDLVAWHEGLIEWTPLNLAIPELAAKEARKLELIKLYPASERQLAFLEDLGVFVGERISSMDASRLIEDALARQNLATDPQKRRLLFYGIPAAEGLTKLEATRLIDEYIAAHPESEEKYQHWKLKTAEEESHRPPKEKEPIALIFSERYTPPKKALPWPQIATIAAIVIVILIALLSSR